MWLRRLLPRSPRRAPRRLCSTLSRVHVADDQTVHCSWADGSAGRFQLLWLRDHCPSTLHPDSGQHTVELRHIAEQQLSPARVAVDNDGRTLGVQWPDAPAASTFDATWLWRHCSDRHAATGSRSSSSSSSPMPDAGTSSQAAATAAIPWHGKDLRDRVQRTRMWSELVQADAAESADSAALACLRELRRVGFVVVGGCPPTPEATQQLAERFGRLQTTFYGGPIWDTAPRAEGEIVDTAYSNVELPLHTDCTYLRHQPGLQLFNCVAQALAPASSPLDGSTRLADGFKAAQILQRDYPSTYDFFCRVPLPFVHGNEVSEVNMRHEGPVFELHPYTSQVVAFRYNELDRAPLGPPLSFDDVRDYYAHQAVLVRVLGEVEVPVRLEVGDAIVIDNHRVLHGRYGFSGYRNLVGCYLTADDWLSNLRVLEGRAALHGSK